MCVCLEISIFGLWRAGFWQPGWLSGYINCWLPTHHQIMPGRASGWTCSIQCLLLLFMLLAKANHVACVSGGQKDVLWGEGTVWYWLWSLPCTWSCTFKILNIATVSWKSGQKGENFHRLVVIFFFYVFPLSIWVFNVITWIVIFYGFTLIFLVYFLC